MSRAGRAWQGSTGQKLLVPPARRIKGDTSVAITLSHGGTTIFTSETPSQEVLVGTREGIVTLQRNAGGAGWHVAQRALTDRHIHAIITEPESGTIFAGAHKGGLYASSDGGKTWSERGDGLTETDVYSL